METQENFFAESREKIEEYIEDRMLLLKLRATEKISKLIGVMFATLLIVVFVFFILLFLSNTAAYYFAEITGSQYWGFGIVAGFYIVLLIVIILIRKKVIERYITNTVVNIFFERNEHNDADENE